MALLIVEQNKTTIASFNSYCCDKWNSLAESSHRPPSWFGLIDIELAKFGATANSNYSIIYFGSEDDIELFKLSHSCL